MEHRVVAGQLGAFYVQGLDPKDSACISTFNTIYGKGTPIMQFTGLLDKNGKEIYEGDVVRALGASVNTGVVEFQSLNSNGYPVNGYIANCKGDWLNIWPSGEIIGNIYENPDLLK